MKGGRTMSNVCTGWVAVNTTADDGTMCLRTPNGWSLEMAFPAMGRVVEPIKVPKAQIHLRLDQGGNGSNSILIARISNLQLRTTETGGQVLTPGAGFLRTQPTKFPEAPKTRDSACPTVASMACCYETPTHTCCLGEHLFSGNRRMVFPLKSSHVSSHEWFVFTLRGVHTQVAQDSSDKLFDVFGI